MTAVEVAVYKLWHGPLRRPFRAFVRRAFKHRTSILLGPLKGSRITARNFLSVLGVYELHVQQAILNLLSEGDVFYDVGANSGYLSLLAIQRVRDSGAVYAFEPLPENITQIKQLMSANGVANYTLVTDAVSNEVGTAELFFARDSNATPTLIERGNEHRLSVSTVTLDQFAAQNRWPKVIKMDIEGAEKLALAGATKILASERAPTWIIEIHDQENDVIVRNFLTENGYGLDTLVSYYRTAAQFPYHIIARRATHP